MVDIEAIAAHFIHLLAAKTNKKIKQVAPEFYEALKQHTWKGNIRELKNVIERSVILCNDELTLEHLPVELQLGEGVKMKSKILSAFEGNVHKSVSVSFLSIIFQVVLSFFQARRTKVIRKPKIVGLPIVEFYFCQGRPTGRSFYPLQNY